MIKKLISILFLALTCFAYGQQQKYSRAKIYLDSNEKSLKHLAMLGLPVDHGESKKGVYFISDFSEKEISIAKQNGYQVEIIIDNVSEYYVNRNKKTILNQEKKLSQSTNCNSPTTAVIQTPSYFHLGSMGGHFTYIGVVRNF